MHEAQAGVQFGPDSGDEGNFKSISDRSPYYRMPQCSDPDKIAYRIALFLLVGSVKILLTDQRNCA
jgi:hypothetical protein